MYKGASAHVAFESAGAKVQEDGGVGGEVDSRVGGNEINKTNVFSV